MNEWRGRSGGHRKRSVKADVPRRLYQAIVRIQAAEDLDWEDACVKAALLVDQNSEEFKEAVRRAAEKLGKSRFMAQLNVGRETIRERAFREGQESTRRWEDNFRVSCSVCGKPMRFSSRDKNWEAEKAVLYEAFKNWYHTTCKGQ